MHVDHVVALERATDNNCMLGFSDIRVNCVQEFNGRIRECVFFKKKICVFFLNGGSLDIRINCVKAFKGHVRMCFFFLESDCFSRFFFGCEVCFCPA
jgi:hypothetical protein